MACKSAHLRLYNSDLIDVANIGTGHLSCVIVGTQYNHGTVEHALLANRLPGHLGSITTNIQLENHGPEECGIITTDLLPIKCSQASSEKDLESNTLWCGIDFCGDE